MLRAAIFLGVQGAIFLAVGSLFGPVGAATALALAVLIAFWAYWSGADAILTATGAREITDNATLEMVQALAARAGIPAPRVFTIEDDQPNAFALGANPDHGVLVLTDSLVARLTRDELAAAIAHELAHIRARDTLSATLGVTILSAISSLAMVLGLLGLMLRRNGGGLLIAVAILAPLLALVVHLAAGRSREYAADAFAAKYVGAGPMIAALEALDHATRENESAIAVHRPALAAIFLVDPLPGSWIGKVFGTHPPIAKRIARLQRIFNTPIA